MLTFGEHINEQFFKDIYHYDALENYRQGELGDKLVNVLSAYKVRLKSYSNDYGMLKYLEILPGDCECIKELLLVRSSYGHPPFRWHIEKINFTDTFNSEEDFINKFPDMFKVYLNLCNERFQKEKEEETEQKRLQAETQNLREQERLFELENEMYENMLIKEHYGYDKIDIIGKFYNLSRLNLYERRYIITKFASFISESDDIVYKCNGDVIEFYDKSGKTICELISKDKLPESNDGNDEPIYSLRYPESVESMYSQEVFVITVLQTILPNLHRKLVHYNKGLIMYDYFLNIKYRIGKSAVEQSTSILTTKKINSLNLTKVLTEIESTVRESQGGGVSDLLITNIQLLSERFPTEDELEYRLFTNL